MNPELRQTRVALDAMGGDHAPDRELDGAVLAMSELGDRVALVLVGDEPRLQTGLRQRNIDLDRIRVVHAAQVIAMDDPPTAAVRQKADSSLAVAMRMHKERRVDAFVSAGNTGAVLSASTLILGRVQGVSRPTIGAFIPAENGVCLLVDAGTNVDCRARHLYEFGVMGSIYFQKVMGKERPSVALLNVGEERGKGTEVVLEAYKLLEASTVKFIGNVEGRDILAAKADVVVCDGFTGNIVLKFGESVPSFLRSLLRAAADRRLTDKLLLGIARGALRRALRVLDPNEYGGVPVLGVDGVSIIGHGSSTAVGIKNMIRTAVEVAESNLHHHIAAALAIPTQPAVAPSVP